MECIFLLFFSMVSQVECAAAHLMEEILFAVWMMLMILIFFMGGGMADIGRKLQKKKEKYRSNTIDR